MSDLTFSDPRLAAMVANWPDGGRRATAMFEVERQEKRGERAARWTPSHPMASRVAASSTPVALAFGWSMAVTGAPTS
jgi:hypothetical protein